MTAPSGSSAGRQPSGAVGLNLIKQGINVNAIAPGVSAGCFATPDDPTGTAIFLGLA